ncbi:MAG: NAD(P)-dependent oxidoreductase [Pseudomonadota bacterium]|nr:NAD(P)-dependent oxidoreductase [Pseudomonadota bacterium]
MRVLVADKLASFVPGRLQDTGAQVTVDTTAKEAALTARIAELDPEVLVVRSTKVTAADIAAGKNLALVIRAGAGVNTIDLAAASSRGVYVANCPGKNAVAVAELAIGHLVNLDRRIADNVAALRAGKWDKKSFGVARGLRGRTLAVLGTGQIGREVIVRAQAFGMRIVAWSRSLTDAEAEVLGVERALTIEAAVANADAVSVHLALAKETRGRIGESVFAAMKPGAYFLNTSRAEVVDQDALVRAIAAKNLRAGLDVFANEPSGGTGPFADSIVDSPNVYGTHHIGASTDEAEEAVGEEVVRIVAAYRAGAAIPNVVNLATRTPATHLLVVRHADRVGVLASVLGVLREAGINIEDMQNIVFSGGDAACARIGIVGALSTDAVTRLESEAHIFSVSQVPVLP